MLSPSSPCAGPFSLSYLLVFSCPGTLFYTCFTSLCSSVTTMEKMDSNSQHVESVHANDNDRDPGGVESGKQEAFYVEDRVAHLSEEHRQYLLARHGTLDLDPIPDMNDADPYNWPTWRVNTITPITASESCKTSPQMLTHLPIENR